MDAARRPDPPSDRPHLAIARTTDQPLEPDPGPRPSRYNLTGHCIMCFRHGCDSPDCDHQYERARWEPCRLCDGSGLDSVNESVCNCLGGVVDMANSEWPKLPAPRPPRSNLAGFCMWCHGRWCTNPRCHQRHTTSMWRICDRCGGEGLNLVTGETCSCLLGLVEMCSSRRPS